ncbi:hydrolase [Dictyobacter sp. S3.2.2.5]|uniref:Hydrolase n=1 Tax=Dictyobacter halimunensis TaxID=3026934 RepID=A0ABQ6G5Y8_9CHLR|nr:hydrolase [Dictyobacter sp. S3.2.2.5]
MEQKERWGQAKVALEGLAVGDAFGELFFRQRDEVPARLAQRRVLAAPWPYTDDTQTALSIVSILLRYGSIRQDELAASFAEHYEGSRGYGPSMHYLLRAIRAGAPWREAAAQQFAGQGSFGNGGAMRIAPLGAYFADDLPLVCEQAELATSVTHTHPEAIAGAIAVAVATACAWQLRQSGQMPTRAEFLAMILPYIPSSEVRRKVRWARNFSERTSLEAVVGQLGNGSNISSQDTVPFVLWCAGERLNSYEEALWLTASALGDVDTTCAMVGGIVATYTGPQAIPASWRAAREPLPDWYLEEI